MDRILHLRMESSDRMWKQIFVHIPVFRRKSTIGSSSDYIKLWSWKHCYNLCYSPVNAELMASLSSSRCMLAKRGRDEDSDDSGAFLKDPDWPARIRIILPYPDTPFRGVRILVLHVMNDQWMTPCYVDWEKLCCRCLMFTRHLCFWWRFDWNKTIKLQGR